MMLPPVLGDPVLGRGRIMSGRAPGASSPDSVDEVAAWLRGARKLPAAVLAELDGIVGEELLALVLGRGAHHVRPCPRRTSCVYSEWQYKQQLWDCTIKTGPCTVHGV